MTRSGAEGGAQVRAGRAEWGGLAVLALPTLLVTMDASVLFLAVPKLTRDLQPSAGQLLWISDVYGFLIAGALVTMGALGDRFGRRRVLLAGGATFAAGSLLAAFSVSPAMLIAARALLGVAGGALAPSSLALISDLFADERQRTTAIGIWISCFAVGAAIGPLLGGVLLEHFWWGSVFLPNVPVMGLLLALGPWLLPESHDAGGGRPDLLGAALAVGAVLPVVFALTRAAEFGLAPGDLVALAAAVGFGVAFRTHQRRAAAPLIGVGLFRAPGFPVALAANTAATFVAIGIELLTAQYLQLVLGLSPLVAGLWSVPSAVAIVAGSMLAPVLVRAARPPAVIAAGLLVATAGLLVMTRAGPVTGLAAIVAGSSLVGLGVGPVGTLGADLVVGSAPSAQAGAASGLSETSTELGGALGIALLGSAGAAIYRHDVAAHVHGAPAAGQTLGGAVDAARALPPSLADRLLSSADSAFVHGLHVAAVGGAVVAACAAVLALSILGRRVPGLT